MTDDLRADPEFVTSCLEEFPPEVVRKVEKVKGVFLDYVGHAPTTARLLRLDPEWNWEPVAFTEDGSPLIKRDSERKIATMWIRLTVRGVTRLGVGTCKLNKEEIEKELIGDAIRNAALRFGVALYLWSKGDLEGEDGAEPTRAAAQRPPAAPQSAPAAPPPPRRPTPAAAPSGAPSASGGPQTDADLAKHVAQVFKRVPAERRQEAIAYLTGETVGDENGTMALFPLPQVKDFAANPALARQAVTALEEAIAVFLLGDMVSQ